MPTASMPDHSDRSIFASLSPRNENAILAFSRLCDYLQSHPSEYAHQRQFMHVDAGQISLGAALQEPADVGNSTDATEAYPEHDPLEQKVWSGRFVFRLNSPPEIARMGWRCGYGRWSRDPHNGRLDIALGLPDDCKRLRIAGNHLRFNFLLDTGVFAIFVNKWIWVDTQHVVVSHNKGVCVLGKPQHALEIGEAKYEFEYSVDDDKAFSENRAIYLRDTLRQSLPLICESPTPSKDDIHVGKWRLLGRIGSGSESVVASAISSDGQLVVMKTINRLRIRSHQIDKEVSRYRNITEKVAEFNDSKFVLAFLESIAGDHSTYIVFSPHARHDFSFLLREPGIHKRQLCAQLYLQALRGIRALHLAGFIHRDLKPANIGICSLDPPRAVVLDMGCTIEADNPSDSTPCPGKVGTIPYVAPEMEDVSFERYSNKVDIWAMACVGVQMLLRNGPSIPWNRVYYYPRSDGIGRASYTFNPWRTFTTFSRPCPTDVELEVQRKRHAKEHERLGYSEDPLENLFCAMLSIGAHWRPNISQVVERFEALRFDN